MNTMATFGVSAHRDARVLGTGACLAWMPRLTAFENGHFGADFTWQVEQNEMWAAAGAAFYAAVIRGAPEWYISGSLSILIVTRGSARRLVAGEIRECDLVPWKPGLVDEAPVLYLATVISSCPEELPLLYGSMASDVSEYLESLNLRVDAALAIAGNAAGQQHLECNGFHALNTKYLGKYELMRITQREARTPFWQRILSKPAAHSSPVLRVAGDPLAVR